MTSRVPPLLETYLSLPPETSQIVLTGVLGASTNWLVLRYLYSFLRASDSRREDGDATEKEEVTVLLVSFMRDYAFWRDGAGRLGVDLEALRKNGRFHFIDGLSQLFLDDASTIVKPAAAQEALTSQRLEGIAQSLSVAVDQLRARGTGGKVIMIMDQPDLLLAATGDEVTGAALRDVLLDVREKAHASVFTLSADEPLISPQTTTLEKEHAAFVLSLAHEAEAVLSLRLLDTGTAKDVSGVVSITRGGDDLGRSIEEHEYLYHIGGDGAVKVFERGGGGG